MPGSSVGGGGGEGGGKSSYEGGGEDVLQVDTTVFIIHLFTTSV